MVKVQRRRLVKFADLTSFLYEGRLITTATLFHMGNYTNFLKEKIKKST